MKDQGVVNVRKRHFIYLFILFSIQLDINLLYLLVYHWLFVPYTSKVTTQKGWEKNKWKKSENEAGRKSEIHVCRYYKTYLIETSQAFFPILS